MTAAKTQDLKRYLALLEYELALQEAHDSLIRFAQVTMPIDRFMDDPSKSKYQVAPHHKLMGELMEDVEAGEGKRIVINVPPRHGKSQLCTRAFAAWYSGRHPDRDVIVATYGEGFARDFGVDVREIIKSRRFRQIFPNYQLDKVASDHLTNKNGGNLYFLGRRSQVTGRGADLILVDDPTKDDKEAGSAEFREDLWQWFTQTLLTRTHTDKSSIVLTQCMTGDTPVLLPDGTEKPLSDIRAGDVVATYDSGLLSSAKVTEWSNQGPDNVFAVTMASGQIVRANARHPFLVEKNGSLEWRRTDTLKPGENILRAITENGKVSPAKQTGATFRQSARDFATPITTRTDGRAGPARLRSTLSAAVARTCGLGMELIWTTITGCLPNRAGCAPYVRPCPTIFPSIGSKSYASIIATVAENFARFCATTATILSGKGTPQSGLKKLPHISDFIPEKIASIQPDGVEDVFDVTVERTENFIANGLVSHNTRWHEDDLPGRLTDPANPVYDEETAADYQVFNLRAVAEDDDPMGRKPGEALWPERFGIVHLNKMRRMNPTSFAALFQSDPTPDDGVFFQKEGIYEYDSTELPDRLTIYCASDHAVSTKNHNDRTCIVPYGVDDRGDAWVLPDVIWDRIEANQAVEEMVSLIKRRNPVFWYSEKGQITRSIGPFLEARMKEESIYVPLVLHPIHTDKRQFAQSGRALCAQGRIRFPKWAPWWQRAKAELLKFPNARFDDFVDVVSIIGMRMNQHHGPGANLVKKKPERGTFADLKAQFRRQDNKDAWKRARAGW